LEGNYYANYFSGGSGWCGVGYGIFGVRRGLTRGFAGFLGKENVGAGGGSSKDDKQKQKQIPPLRCGMTNKEQATAGVDWEKGTGG
jgi:hypothetical protein